MGKRATVKVISENDTGRNTKFKDMTTGREMTRPQFVNEIKSNNYDKYYVRNVNGVPTPVSKPDGNERNNLG